MNYRKTFLQIISENLTAFGLRWAVRDLRRMILKVVSDEQHPQHKQVCQKLIEINRLEMEIQQLVGFDNAAAALIKDPTAKGQIDINKVRKIAA